MSGCDLGKEIARLDKTFFCCNLLLPEQKIQHVSKEILSRQAHELSSLHAVGVFSVKFVYRLSFLNLSPLRETRVEWLLFVK